MYWFYNTYPEYKVYILINDDVGIFHGNSSNLVYKNNNTLENKENPSDYDHFALRKQAGILTWQSTFWAPGVCSWCILSSVKAKCILLDGELWFTLEITTETSDAQQVSHYAYKKWCSCFHLPAMEISCRSDSMRFDYRICKTKHYKYVIIVEH